jgi:methionyl-tRNA formyltransferase
MGTPAFAASILDAVLAWEHAEVAGVFTQPDRPAGRGRKPRPSEVKRLAQARRLPVFQPENFKDPANVDMVRSLDADVGVVAAYGLILPQSVLEAPRHGCINVHASLLPRYRGAAPIQRAVMEGEPLTGITIMQMDQGMDTGDILLQRALGIDIDETAGDLHDEMAALGGTLLLETLEMLRQNRLAPIPQDESRATYAPKLRKEEGEVDWSQSARRVHNLVRGLHPWPGAYMFWRPLPEAEALRLNLFPGRVGDALEEPAAPGTILGLRGEHLAIACADREYLVPRVQPQGRQAMDAAAFHNGYLARHAG